MIDRKRGLPLLLMVTGLASVAAGLGIAISEGEGAGPPVQFFPLGTATLAPFAGDVHLKGGGHFRLSISGADTIFGIREVKIQPGAFLPWHQHPGSAVIMVAQGTVTEYNTALPHCGPLTRGPGYSRFEPGNTTHMLLNRGKVPAVVLAATWDSTTYAKSGKLILPMPAPTMAGCPTAP